MTTVPWQGRNPSSKARLLVWLLLLLPLLIVAVYPTVQDYLRAASLLQRISDPHATGWIAHYDVHPVAARDTTFEFRGGAIPARLYMPSDISSAPGIMVVHGMHDLGINEPRLVSFARSLAASGFFVMTPQVPGIADYRVEAESADLIGTAAHSFAQELNTPAVGMLALSFSGGLALLAASDPQYSPSIAWIATVGAYYDLAHVLRFFATGEAVRPDGSVEHAYAPRLRAAHRRVRRAAGFLRSARCRKGPRSNKAFALRKRRGFETVGGDPDARRTGNHAADLSPRARVLRSSSIRRSGQAETATRSCISRGPPSVSFHAGAVAARLR